MSNKRRLTITLNGMPEELSNKVQELSDNRKLTAYFVGLIEKEEKMDKLIYGLSSILDKMDSFSEDLSSIKNIITEKTIHFPSQNHNKIFDTEIVQQGKLEISDNIQGGIEEVVPDEYDF